MMNKIKMTPVVSSQIKSVGHDEDEQKLYVEFKNGRVYEYSNVPEYIYTKLINNHSPGGYFTAVIRGMYDYLSLNIFVTDNTLEIE